MTPRSVLVVGAGIAGLCCAYHLRRLGLEVAVIESNRVGSGASFGNAGWVCPAQAGPLPEPGLASDGLRALADRDSALYFKPAALPGLAPWLLRFWRRCGASHHRRGVEAVARLGRDVFDMFDEMEADGVEFESHRIGMLVAARSPAALREHLARLEPMRRYGYELPGDVTTGAELHELEPALAPAVDAGFVIEQHRHVRPDTLTAGLAAALRRMGVEIVEGAEVVDFERTRNRVHGVRSAAGRHPAEAVVLAAGAWTGPLARMLGLRLPLQGGKGYSFFVTPAVMPRRCILLADVHVGCSPLSGRLRIAGTMEFSGLSLQLDPRRIAAIAAGARASLQPLRDDAIAEPWAGLRPILPDGLPLIDRAAPYENIFLATGYSMQGITLAAPAGRALAEMIVSGRRPEVLEPFGLRRLRLASALA